MDNIYSAAMAIKSDFSMGAMPRYHIFFFEQEPPSIWRLTEGAKPVEYVPNFGWYDESNFLDFQSDIINSVDTFSGYYDDLPVWIKAIIEDFT